ncbi:MAG TPA: hypothetical protein VF411_11595 [Bacteroidia bacterium]
MAKQKGIIPIIGTLGELTFVKTKDGYLVKTRTTLTKERIMKDPAFARTRENMTEFSEAAHDGKLLRTALHVYMANAKDGRVTSRLTKLMRAILKLDGGSIRGRRSVGTAIVLPTAMATLQGFNFNIKSVLTQVLLVPYVLTPATGVITINNLFPTNDIIPPTGATDFTLQAIWGKVDFVNKVYNVQSSPAVHVALTAPAATITLTPTTAPTGTGTNVYLLLIQFYQMVNTVEYVLHSGTFNSLAIVGVA